MDSTKILSKKWSSCSTELCDVRSNMSSVCRQLNFTEEDTQAIVLAIDEACTNIIRYGYDSCSTGEILIEVLTTDSEVIFQLHDHAQKVSDECIKVKETSDLEPGGLGLMLMKKIMDSVHFVHTDDCPGNILEMKKKLPNGDKE